jgi:hypothetical protein
MIGGNCNRNAQVSIKFWGKLRGFFRINKRQVDLRYNVSRPVFRPLMVNGEWQVGSGECDFLISYFLFLIFYSLLFYAVAVDPHQPQRSKPSRRSGRFTGHRGYDQNVLLLLG